MRKKSQLAYGFDKGISLLSKQDFEQLYSPPKLSLEEKEYYFSMDKGQLSLLNKFPIASKVIFILELGYFNASRQFYSFSINQVSEDIKFILSKYFQDSAFSNLKWDIRKNTRSKLRKRILEIAQYKEINGDIDVKVNQRIKELLSIDINPKYLFYELIRFCDKEKIVIPAYSKIQTLISAHYISFENELYSQIDKILNQEDKIKLDKLLEKEMKSDKASLVLIRLPAKGFTPSEVTAEILKKKELEELFKISKRILRELAFNNQSIKYAAKVVDRYWISQIENFTPLKKYLYLVCFIYYRYLKVNDDLVTTFLYLTGKYEGQVDEQSRDKMLIEYYQIKKNNFKMSRILELILDKDGGSLSREKFFEILPEEEMRRFQKYLDKNDARVDNIKWEFYDEKYSVMIRNIRPLMTELEFSFEKSKESSDFAYALKKLQTALKEGKEIDWGKLSTDFITKQQKNHIIKDGKINSKRLELYIYNKLREKILFGEVYIENSWENKTLEDYLVEKNYFQNNKKEILAKLNLPLLEKPMTQLIKDKSEKLDKLFHSVNKKILSGKNEHFQKKGDNDWYLKYDSVSDEEIDNILTRINDIELVNLLMFVQEKTGFLSEFVHIANKRVKSEVDENLLLATLIAYGTNQGPYKMQSDVGYTYKQMVNTGNTRFREDTLLKANEKIVNKTASLPIFKYFNIGMDSIHSGSDGQKFAVGVKTIMARYSQKYFGLDKGISVLTLSANYQPLTAKVISPNEYEGHHVLDLLLMNRSDIQSEKHSTDTHGVNEINFALLDFFGYSFCPRYKRLNKKAEKLVSPNPLSEYPKEYPIRPSRVMRPSLILQEEDNIKRIIASLALKKSTASTIVKKIANLPEGNSLRRALAEYNKLISSAYILEYIDNMSLRSNVQRSLNRSEAYHNMKRAVAYADEGKVRAKSETEQNVYQNSTMLICSAIIYYNSKILSLMLEDKMGDLEQIKRTTPVAWSNIILYGKYYFPKNNISLDLKKQIPQFIS